MRASSIAFGLVAMSLGESTSGFATLSAAGSSHSVALGAQRCDTSSPCDRSAFLKTSLASIAAVTTLSPAVAFADDSAVDDLSMPSPEEQKAAEDAMAERLRIKAELKKKASKPMGYKESMAAEMAKQKDLQKTKEERRIALCEELGRGC